MSERASPVCAELSFSSSTVRMQLCHSSSPSRLLAFLFPDAIPMIMAAGLGRRTAASNGSGTVIEIGMSRAPGAARVGIDRISDSKWQMDRQGDIIGSNSTISTRAAMLVSWLGRSDALVGSGGVYRLPCMRLILIAITNNDRLLYSTSLPHRRVWAEVLRAAVILIHGGHSSMVDESAAACVPRPNRIRHFISIASPPAPTYAKVMCLLLRCCSPTHRHPDSRSALKQGANRQQHPPLPQSCRCWTGRGRVSLDNHCRPYSSPHTKYLDRKPCSQKRSKRVMVCMYVRAIPPIGTAMKKRPSVSQW